MAIETLRGVALSFGKQQAAYLGNLEKSSGIVATMGVQPATHNAYDVQHQGVNVATGTITVPGGSVTPDNQEIKSFTTHLSIMKNKHSVPIEIADSYNGGKAAYFREKEPLIMEGLGQTIAKNLIYGNNSTFGSVAGFKGFHQYAKKFNNVIQAGGATGSRTTIFAVRWEQDACAVLFNKALMAAGEMVKRYAVAGLQPTNTITNTTTDASRLEYIMQYYSYLSLLGMGQYNIAAYTQLQDATDDRPTADNMAALLDMVKSFKGGKTYIYASLLGKRLLGKLKDGKLDMVPIDSNYDRRVEGFDGVPIIVDENILNTETTVLD